MWDERGAVLEAGESKDWRPFLDLVQDLAGYGQLTSGVLADHLRRSNFFCHPELERCPVTRTGSYGFPKGTKTTPRGLTWILPPLR